VRVETVTWRPNSRLRPSVLVSVTWQSPSIGT
jgi:hypothetical protein